MGPSQGRRTPTVWHISGWEEYMGMDGRVEEESARSERHVTRTQLSTANYIHTEYHHY